MKKLLLTAAAVSTLGASSAMATQGDWYGTLYGGANKLQKANSAKSETTGHIGGGIGYYINEIFRADLTLDHLFDPDFKQSGKDSAGNRFNAKISGEVNALMVNAYADLFDMGMAQFYAGAGAGVARVKAKTTIVFPDLPAVNNITIKAKESNEFAYALHVGVSTELSHGVHGFLMYSWKDYGKTSKFIDSDKNKSKGAKFRGHHGSVGVRVDF